MHAPFTGGLRPFDSALCEPCGVTVTTLLSQESLTRMDLELVALQFQWSNLVRLHAFYVTEAQWADLQMSVVLGIKCPAPSTPVPILQALLHGPEA